MILLRPERAGGGYTVFLVKRAQQIAFMGGAHVFPGGRVDPKTDPNVEAAAVREVEEESGVKLDVRHLHLFARWVTPAVEPKRFDARFFVAAVPADQVAAADRSEVTEGDWMAPAAALERCERGEIILPPPTLWNLADLAALPTIEAVVAEAGRRARAGIHPVCPTGELRPEPPRVVLHVPGGRFELLEGGRWSMIR